MAIQPALHTTQLRRVFVFSLSVRLFHWINALSIFVLAVTGYLIGNPPALLTSQEAYQGYWFGITRFIHFIFAYIFLFNFVIRIYRLFFGNRFETWRNFIPSNKGFFREIWQVVRTDFLFTRGHLVSIGHNALAGISYLFLFILMILQIITGFGIYAAMSDAVIVDLFNWVVPIFGGDAATRLWHHIFMWGFVVFTLIHIYLVFYHDYVDGRGEVSSIFGGWKFVESDTMKEQDTTDYNK